MARWRPPKCKSGKVAYRTQGRAIDAAVRIYVGERPSGSAYDDHHPRRLQVPVRRVAPNQQGEQMSIQTMTPTATASPAAVARITGLLRLRPHRVGEHDSCELREDGSAIWRLEGGITVEMRMDEAGDPHWHLDYDGWKV